MKKLELTGYTVTDEATYIATYGMAARVIGLTEADVDTLFKRDGVYLYDDLPGRVHGLQAMVQHRGADYVPANRLTPELLIRKRYDNRPAMRYEGEYSGRVYFDKAAIDAIIKLFNLAHYREPDYSTVPAATGHELYDATVLECWAVTMHGDTMLTWHGDGFDAYLAPLMVD